MSERELEGIMEEFIDGDTDVLVCTTIIETGLDIPNVNTIIIQDADRMGLFPALSAEGTCRKKQQDFLCILYVPQGQGCFRKWPKRDFRP